MQLQFTEDLESICSTALVIQRFDGSHTIVPTSSLEFYSADLLCLLWHYRFSGLADQVPPEASPSGTYQWISSTDVEYLDKESNLIHIARPGSLIWDQIASSILKNLKIGDLKDLIRSVILHGFQERNRSEESIDGEEQPSTQYRAGIGSSTQCYDGPGHPKRLTGTQFFDSLEKDIRFDLESVKKTLASLVLAAWKMQQELQMKATGIPISPDSTRNSEFATHLRRYLNIEDTQFNAEHITIVVGALFPNLDACIKHLDKMNDNKSGYTRTGVLNIILSVSSTGMVLHLQVRLNQHNSRTCLPVACTFTVLLFPRSY